MAPLETLAFIQSIQTHTERDPVFTGYLPETADLLYKLTGFAYTCLRNHDHTGKAEDCFHNREPERFREVIDEGLALLRRSLNQRSQGEDFIDLLYRLTRYVTCVYDTRRLTYEGKAKEALEMAEHAADWLRLASPGIALSE